MKKRYIFGLFFILLLIFLLILCVLWNRQRGEIESPIIEGVPGQEMGAGSSFQTDEEEETNTDIKNEVEKTAQMEEGYILGTTDGYVTVFRAKDRTFYFQSDIQLEDLPSALQEEIKIGKYIVSELEVYHFLESYSS